MSYLVPLVIAAFIGLYFLVWRFSKRPGRREDT